MAIILNWRHSSQFSNPEPNSYYTDSFTVSDGYDYRYDCEFFVDGLSLIFKRVAYYMGEKESVTYFNLGEFPDLLDNHRTMELIKRYADYVVAGYQETFLLTHCPSFELIDDVDENYNPLPLAS
jgi:hypothetical protein